MENKQTATEWLIEQVKSPSWSGLFIWHKEEIFQQAITMNKEQIMKAVDAGFDDGSNFIEDIKFTNAEQYYNETYEK